MLGENLPRRGAELLHHDLPVRFDLGHGLVRECDPETAGRDLAARRSLEDRVGGFLCAARIDRRQLPSRPDLREETVAGDFLAAAEVFAGAGVAGHDDHRVAVAFQPDQLFAILGETADDEIGAYVFGSANHLYRFFESDRILASVEHALLTAQGHRLLGWIDRKSTR